MRISLCFLILVSVSACGPQTPDYQKMQARTDSLQHQLESAYKPGFGEFMSGIQVHHAKLWFAGMEQNWKLAQFEIDEIKESLEGIRQFNTDRPESKSLPMLAPAIDSISNAIQQKNPQLFKSSFVFLTNSCNNCHRATNHEFNVIKIPDAPPFSNQVFK